MLETSFVKKKEYKESFNPIQVFGMVIKEAEIEKSYKFKDDGEVEVRKGSDHDPCMKLVLKLIFKVYQFSSTI